MSDEIEIVTADGHAFAAYRSAPAGEPRAGIVMLQEFFGVNDHIRRVADDYANRGYLVLAPAIFDRVERNVSLPYDAAGMARGRELRAMLKMDNTLADIQATIATAHELGGNVATLGYCWGGVLGYLASLRLHGVSAAVAYYGANIPEYLAEPTRGPVLMHFAGADEYMKPGDVAAIRAAHPEITIYEYPGTEHGFNCDDRPFYNAGAAKLARERTLTFLAGAVG